jgi:hypothetical protein
MASGQQLRRHLFSQRVAILSQEVKNIAALSAQYRAKTTYTQTGRIAHQERELRLLQIRDELAQMLEKQI